MADLRSTMQDFPLTLAALLRHPRDVHPNVRCSPAGMGPVESASVADVVERAARLGSALAGLGVRAGDRVGSMCVNHRAHLEVFHAVPAMGAVLHLVNVRLSDEQTVYVVNDAEDSVLVVDADLLARLERLLPWMPSVRAVVVVGGGAAGRSRIDYEDLVRSRLRARFGAGVLAVVEVGRGPAASPEPSPALPAGPTHP